MSRKERKAKALQRAASKLFYSMDSTKPIERKAANIKFRDIKKKSREGDKKATALKHYVVALIHEEKGDRAVGWYK